MTHSKFYISMNYGSDNLLVEVDEHTTQVMLEALKEADATKQEMVGGMWNHRHDPIALTKLLIGYILLTKTYKSAKSVFGTDPFVIVCELTKGDYQGRVDLRGCSRIKEDTLQGVQKTIEEHNQLKSLMFS